MSLFIAYCHPGMVHEGFMRSVNRFLMLDHSDSGRQECLGLMAIRGLYVAQGRNQACKQFLESSAKADWLLFLDTDIVFKPTDVYDLLDHAGPDKQIIGALYFGYCEGELLPVWRQKRGEHQAYGTLPRITFDVIKEYDAIGMGFTLIRRDALETILETHKDDPWPWFGHDVYGAGRLGEDVTFCERAARLGIKTWGDSSIVVGHEKPRIETAETFKTLWTPEV